MLYDFDEKDNRSSPLAQGMKTYPGYAAEFYVPAFLSGMNRVWGKTFPDELRDICYRGGLSSFRDSGRQQIFDRHVLTYTFLAGAFSSSEQTDALNRYASQIPTKTWVPKALSALCAPAYADDPTRRFTTNQTANDALARYYTEGKANSVFRFAHEQGTLHNIALARPEFDYSGTMDISITLPDAFRARWKKNKIVELWIPTTVVTGDYRMKPVFRVWTDAAYWDADVYGDRVGPVIVNDYGRIPYVPLQLRQSQSADDPYGGGLWDLVYANIIDNSLQWAGMLSAYFNGFSVWLAKNIDFGNRKSAGLGPGALIDMQNVMAPNQQDIAASPVEPSLEAVAADGQYTTIGMYAQGMKEDALFDIGVPDFLASRNGAIPTTATEWIIRYHGLLDKRKADLPALNTFEREFAECVCRVANVDRREAFPDQLPEMSTDFADVTIPNSVENELKYEAGLVAAGLYRLGPFLAKWEGLDQVPTDEEAVAIITKRQSDYGAVIPVLREIILGIMPKATVVAPGGNVVWDVPNETGAQAGATNPAPVQTDIAPPAGGASAGAGASGGA